MHDHCHASPLYNYAKHHDLSGYDQTFIQLQRYCFLSLCAIPTNDDLVSDELGTRRSPRAGIDLDGIDATGSASQRDVIAAATGRESMGSHTAAVDPIDIDHKGVAGSRVEP